MPFKSKTQPFCRCCGKPIRKDTDTLRFGGRFMAANEPEARRNLKPQSKAEAQKHVNQQIVSVRWATRRVDPNNWDSKEVRDYIDQVSVWDGESYIDEFFCNGTCATMFAYVAAAAGLKTRAYTNAIEENSHAN